MKPERLLFPVDIAKCPLDTFELVNGFAKRPEVSVVLLHILPAASRGEDAEAAAHCYLERLADEYIHPIATTLTRVRHGEVAQEILAEAKLQNTDLIILPTYRRSLWRQFRAWCESFPPPSLRYGAAGASRITHHASDLTAVAIKIVRETPCGVFLAQAKTRFDCARAWGRPAPQETAAGHAGLWKPGVLNPAHAARSFPLASSMRASLTSTTFYRGTDPQ